MDFFSDEKALQVSLVRASDRRSYTLKGGGIEQLLFGSMRTSLQVAIIELPPGGTYPVADSHPGEEFTYVVAGRLRICLAEDTCYDLDTEDVVYYRSTLPHRWENAGPDPVKFMVVNTPASF